MKKWKEVLIQLVKEELKSREQEISQAHNFSHLKNVAELTQKIGTLYNFSEREKELAYAAGLFHDIVRSPKGGGRGDEEASFNKARQILKGLITKEEEEAIGFAIKKHGFYPQWLSNPETRERLPETLKEKIHFALFVADKMEQNGIRGIVRRCSFTAGDRLRSKKGDWRDFGFKPDKDEGLVVVLASIYRLTFINPEEIYPQKLYPILHPLYEIQREFVLALCQGLNLTLEDIAHLLLKKKNNKGENILQAVKISGPTSISELVKVIASKSGITNEKIVSVPKDWAFSALETVEYFSHNYKKDLSQLILKWKPQGEKAKEWQKMMREYEERRLSN